MFVRWVFRQRCHPWGWFGWQLLGVLHILLGMWHLCDQDLRDIHVSSRIHFGQLVGHGDVVRVVVEAVVQQGFRWVDLPSADKCQDGWLVGPKLGLWVVEVAVPKIP